jgi:hypothetical protein
MHPIDFHDRAIGLAALANFLNLDGKGGSYALANVLSTTFTDSVQTVAEDVRDVAQADIVEGIVTANWGLDEPTPLLVFDEIGSRQDAAAASLALLAGAGLIKPDPELEAAIRQNAGLPAPDPSERRRHRRATCRHRRHRSEGRCAHASRTEGGSPRTQDKRRRHAVG